MLGNYKMTKVEYLEMRIFELQSWMEVANYPNSLAITIERQINFEMIQKLKSEKERIQLAVSIADNWKVDAKR